MANNPTSQAVAVRGPMTGNYELKINSDGSINTTSTGAGNAVNITEVGGVAVGAQLPIADGMGTDVPGTLTTGTSVVAATNIDGFSTVTFSMQGTYNTLNAVFEQSDDSGVTWYAVDASRVGSGVVENNVAGLTNQALIWRATVSGCDSFRIRATALTSGTVNVLISITAMPTSAAVGVVVNGPGVAGAAVVGNPILNGGSDGTNARTFLTDANGNQFVLIASSQAGSQSFAGSANFLNVTTPDELPFTGTASSAIVIPVSINGGATQAFIDMSGYESISLQITSPGVGTTITSETSDDNTNYLATSGVNSIPNLAVGSTSTGVSVITYPKRGRYIRFRVSTYGSGTVTIVGNLHKNPQPMTNRITVDGPFSSGVPSTYFPIVATARSVNGIATNGNGTGLTATIAAILVQRPYSIPEADWQTAVSLSTTGSTALQAAGGAGVKNYLTAIQFSGNAALVANTIQILSGASIIWGPHTIAAATAFTQITFPTPLQTGAATALNVQIGTTPVGALEVTAQGYAAAD